MKEYIDTLDEDDTIILYLDLIEGKREIEWSDEFTDEIERRKNDYESDKDKGVTLEEAMKYARTSLQSVRAKRNESI